MADTILWCVEDGDGVHPMPSKSEAYRYAKRIRTMIKNMHRNSPSPYWPPVWEEVKRYMYDDESHKKSVEEYLKDKRRVIKSPKRRREIKKTLLQGKNLFF
ncbi:hypothetical protein [Zymobacter sp. IVIA_12111.31 C1]|uniref:hypothetical protein n=1 Tax=Zymobacter sp. IVIA_12111.31 C1 TaxID=3394854 RepID=UPI0039C1A2AA